MLIYKFWYLCNYDYQLKQETQGYKGGKNGGRNEKKVKKWWKKVTFLFLCDGRRRKEKKIAILIFVPAKFPNFDFDPCKIPEF